MKLETGAAVPRFRRHAPASVVVAGPLMPKLSDLAP